MTMEWSDTGCFRSVALRADDFDDSNALVRTRVWPEDKYFKFIDFEPKTRMFVGCSDQDSHCYTKGMFDAVWTQGADPVSP